MSSGKRRPSKYGQYSEEQVIGEIKRYRLEGYNDKDIMKNLNGMPRSTFYDYVKRMYEQEKAFYEEQRKHAQDMLREEVGLAKDRLLESYRALKTIRDSTIADPEIKRQDKADVEGEIRETVVAILKLVHEKPVITGEIETESNTREAAHSREGAGPEAGQATTQQKF